MIWEIFVFFNEEVEFKVNKYIWIVLFEIFDFLFIEFVDLFFGVIMIGYGIFSGGG